MVGWIVVPSGFLPLCLLSVAEQGLCLLVCRCAWWLEFFLLPDFARRSARCQFLESHSGLASGLAKTVLHGSSGHLSSVIDGIDALGKAHMRYTPSLRRSFPSDARHL